MESINLEMVRGDDEGWEFEVVYANGETVDFAGCRFDLHIKPEKGELIKLSSETGEITVNGNQIQIAISHNKTEGVKWEAARWDLQCIDTFGAVRTFAGGDFSLIHDVTTGVNNGGQI